MVLLGLLPTLALLSWLAPERHWPTITARLAALRWASRGPLGATEHARIAAILGGGTAGWRTEGPGDEAMFSDLMGNLPVIPPASSPGLSCYRVARSAGGVGADLVDRLHGAQTL